MSSSPVKEYELFTNDKNTLAFFFYREAELDNLPEEGPYYFVIKEDNILAGTADHNIILRAIPQEVLDKAREKGSILLMEFENQQPVRATPCYFVEAF